jgi:5-amino-6-(5-phosphoribosylamino)uracil reductase
VDRPYVLLSCAMSIDGYIDDASGARLTLSGEQDLDRVDELRAGCDAILVGAGTIRADNPRLLVRSPARRQARAARGLDPDPVKVALTRGGDLDPGAAFFAAGRASRIVYAGTPAVAAASARLGDLAEVADAGEPPELTRVLADLAARGIGRLLVEGGTAVHTAFLAAALADELHLVIAPVLVGDSRAPRFVADGAFAWTAAHPARLVEVRQLGGDVLLRYALSDRAR